MDLFGGLFGAAGQIAGAAISASAVRDATRMQIDALNQQRQFVYSQLNPSVVNAQATAADIQNARARLALQGQIDPALLAARYGSEASIARQAQTLGQEGAAVGNVAAGEAITGVPGMQEGKSALVDAALTQLKQGATLPPDVENQLVQAGLEQSGMVTQSASGQGVGGQLLRTILGTAGLQLKQQRETQAAALMGSAQNLETQRQQILQQLFPSLTQTQLASLGGQQSVLNQSNAFLPNAGLSGSNIANIWLARVGATNQLTQSAANAAAQGAMGQGQIFGNAIGGASGYISRALPSLSQDTSGAGGVPASSYTTLSPADLTPI